MSSTDSVAKSKFVSFKYFIHGNNDEITDHAVSPADWVFLCNIRFSDKVEVALTGAFINVEEDLSGVGWRDIDPRLTTSDDSNGHYHHFQTRTLHSLKDHCYADIAQSTALGECVPYLQRLQTDHENEPQQQFPRNQSYFFT